MLFKSAFNSLISIHFGLICMAQASILSNLHPVCVLFVYSTIPCTLFVKEWLVCAFLPGLKDNWALHCLCHLLFVRFPVPNFQMVISGQIGIKSEPILGILVLICFCFISIPILIYSHFYQSS